MKATFVTQDGEKKEGLLIRKYEAYPGEMRYVFLADGIKYRCLKDKDGNYTELVLATF